MSACLCTGSPGALVLLLVLLSSRGSAQVAAVHDAGINDPAVNDPAVNDPAVNDPAVNDAADAPRITLVTFGPGDQVHQYFGHDALVVGDPADAQATVYNYGMFSFGRGMIPSFLQGRLHFWVGVGRMGPTTRKYIAANRDVRLRELNLDAAQARAVLAQLQHDARPENRRYLYDHYTNNCATRVRDVLDRAVSGQLSRAWAAPGRFSLRQHTRRYTQHDLLIEWLMMFGLNASVDRPASQAQEAFLPDELERLLDRTQIVTTAGLRVPIVARAHTVFAARRPKVPAQPPAHWPGLLALGALLAAAIAWLGRRTPQHPQGLRRGFFVGSACLALPIGLLGVVLSLLWVATDHTVAHANWNLLLSSPLTLLVGIASIAASQGSAAAARGVCVGWLVHGAGSVLLLLLTWLPGFAQDVSLPAALLVPINVAFAASARRGLQRSSASPA